MKKLLLLMISATAGVPAMNAQINWVKVADFDDLPTSSTEEDLMATGWIFHDYDFALYANCTDGTTDCTGVREVVEAPFEGGSGNAISIRGSDPDEIDPANAMSGSAFPLPEPIPVGEVATFYLRFSHEGRAISNHFGLMADDGSTNDLDNNAARIAYGDLAVTTQTHYGSSDYLRAYVNGGWNDATFNVDHVIETGTWYELWWQVHNEPSNVGGGYFDIYIRGGVFENVTHLDNPYDDDFTDYPFRNKPDAALDRFLVVMSPGWPSAGPLRRDAVYYDDLYMVVGELTTESPLCDGDDCGPIPPVSLWNDLPAVDGWKGTSIGWVYDEEYQWIYHGGANTWMYVDGSSSLDSIYIYNYTAAGWVWTSDNLGGWYYDFAAGDWAVW